MRRGLIAAAAIVAVLGVAGCSAPSAPPTFPKPSDIGVVGTSGETSQSAPATQTKPVAAPNPAVVERMPPGLGIQVASASGPAAISEAKAIQIASKRKPAGAKSVAALHVLFAKSGDKKPTDAWMVTFHDAQLPGAGGASSKQIGSVTIVIDSASGALVDELAYVPEAK